MSPVHDPITPNDKNGVEAADQLSATEPQQTPQSHKSSMPLKAIIEKAEDDFFAFHDDSSDEDRPKRKKKKKSKDKSKSHHKKQDRITRDDDTISNNNDGAEISVSSASSDLVKSERLHIHAEADSSKSGVKKPVADLTFLGLSEDQPTTTLPKAKNPSLNRGKAIGNNKRASRSTSTLEYSSDEKSDGYGDEDLYEDSEEKDDFLTQINNQLDKGLEVISSTDSNFKPAETKYIDFNGTQVKISDVLFELNITFETHNLTASFKVRVKGSTRVNKIVEKSKEHLEAISSTSFASLGLKTDDILFILPDHNLTLQKVLRISSVINRVELKFNDVRDSYELNVLLTTPSYVENIRPDNSSWGRVADILPAYKKMDRYRDDDEIIVKINDKSIEPVIELDDDDTSTTTPPPLNNLHTIFLKRNGTLNDIHAAFVSLMKYPFNLRLNFTFQGKQLDQFEVDDNLEAMGIVDGCTIDAEYDLNQLNQNSNREYENNDINSTVDNEIKTNDDPARQSGKYHDMDLLDEGDELDSTQKSNKLKSFTIRLKGKKDSKPIECKVNEETILLNVRKFYINTLKLSNDLHLKLLFDDEEMNLNSTIADTELEADDLIDVLY